MNASMTKKELSRFYIMNREYIKQKKSLEEVQASLSRCQRCNSIDCPKKHELELYSRALKKLMELTISVCDYEKQQLQRYIDTIPDCRMHQILFHRYISGLSWNQVAASMDGDLTGRAVKKMHDRFLKRDM